MSLAYYTHPKKKIKTEACSLEKKGAQQQKIESKRQELNNDEISLSKIKEGQQTYSDALRKVSEIIHPFSIEDSIPQTSSQVESSLKEQSQEFEDIANDYDINDSKGRLKKYVKQIKDMASGVDS